MLVINIIAISYTTSVIVIKNFQKSIIVIVIEKISAYLQLQLLYYLLR